MRSGEPPALDENVLAHYESGPRPEDERLRNGTGRIELLRTQELVRRYLGTDGPRRILDVGGAAGVHSEWLAADGHDVHLVDPVLDHVEQALALARASSATFTA